jgi:hypothetical protein
VYLNENITWRLAIGLHNVGVEILYALYKGAFLNLHLVSDDI